MLEDLWSGILELLTQFVIPDWGALIALLPVFILVIIVIVLVRTFFRLARAKPARRGKQRIVPRTPPGIHMPGPSYAPIFASLGAALLFLGLVFGGPILVLGAVALILTLLYWLGEALHIYDHDLGSTAPALPAVSHDGPPPGVHMPGPSFRPFLGAVGTAMLMLGLVFGGWLLPVGVIALVSTLLGWLVDARHEYVKTVEADSTGHLENIPAPRTPSTLLTALTVLLIGAVILQAGVFPSGEANGGEPGASRVTGRLGRARWTARLRATGRPRCRRVPDRAQRRSSSSRRSRPRPTRRSPWPSSTTTRARPTTSSSRTPAGASRLPGRDLPRRGDSRVRRAGPGRGRVRLPVHRPPDHDARDRDAPVARAIGPWESSPSRPDAPSSSPS